MTRCACPEAAVPVSKARPFTPYRALGVQSKVARPANGSPFGGAGAKRLRGQARRVRTAHAAISRLFVSAMLSPRPRITVSILALSVTFGDTSPKGRGFSASASLSCNQTVAFFTLFSKIKGKLKNVLLKKWRICVTLHPSCNGIFGDSGVFLPVFYGSGGGGRVITTHFFYFSARFGCFPAI